MTAHLKIYWTASLRTAAEAVASEPRDDYANTHDVRHRAAQGARFCTVGEALTGAQVDQIQQLRSRLDCRSVEPLQSHRDFEAAWSGAYAEAQDAHAADACREIRTTMLEAIAELEACTTDDEIFAWPYGLAVGLTSDGKAYAASLDKAATAGDVFYVIRNGADVPAIRTRRQDAIAAHLIELRKIMAEHLGPEA